VTGSFPMVRDLALLERAFVVRNSFRCQHTIPSARNNSYDDLGKSSGLLWTMLLDLDCCVGKNKTSPAGYL
jgi:hypothetical protein